MNPTQESSFCFFLALPTFSKRTTTGIQIALGIITLGGAIVAGFSLVGYLPIYAAWIGGATASLSLIAFAIVSVKRCCSVDDEYVFEEVDEESIETIKQRYRPVISNADDIRPTKEEIRESKAIACNQIINGLYVGNSEAFVRTTHFPCTISDHRGRSPIDTSNSQAFTEIITVCQLVSIAADFFDMLDKTIEDFTTSFENRGVSWHYVGKMIFDHSENWEALVHDCTYPGSNLAKIAIPAAGFEETEFLRIRSEKEKVIMVTPVENWFEPIFEAIDQGVIDGKKVLVHCQAGQSRSAAILAAYLINRFRVSSQQAFAFLRSKRKCIDSAFAEKLNEYAQVLAALEDDKSES